MPVKNAGKFLSPCLDSILNQTLQDWELIAINDGSEDDSEAILSQYSNEDSRIQYYNNEGSGIIEALRQAYASSNGTYITRMDADDLMYDHKLEILSSELTKLGIGHLAIGNVEYISETSLGDGYRKYAEWLNNLTRSGSNWLDIYKECVVPSPAWMLHRTDLDACGAFLSDTYPEDYDLCFRFYQSGLTCIPSQEVIHQWRDHPSRTSRTSEVYRDNRFLGLKMQYFLSIDYDNTKQLVLWGAGKKGKAIAKTLTDQNIDFQWITNNEKKIGHRVYGKTIQSESSKILNETNQILIAVANPDEQTTISDALEFLALEKGKAFFLMC